MLPDSFQYPLNVAPDKADKKAAVQLPRPSIPPGISSPIPQEKYPGSMTKAMEPLSLTLPRYTAFNPASHRFLPRHLTRSPQVTFCRLLLSHTLTFSPNPPPTCSPLCSQKTTVPHILLQCPFYQLIRSNVGLTSSFL